MRDYETFTIMIRKPIGDKQITFIISDVPIKVIFFYPVLYLIILG